MLIFCHGLRRPFWMLKTGLRRPFGVYVDHLVVYVDLCRGLRRPTIKFGNGLRRPPKS